MGGAPIGHGGPEARDRCRRPRVAASIPHPEIPRASVAGTSGAASSSARKSIERAARKDRARQSQSAFPSTTLHATA